jgi:hypothetical protein
MGEKKPLLTLEGQHISHVLGIMKIQPTSAYSSTNVRNVVKYLARNVNEHSMINIYVNGHIQ